MLVSIRYLSFPLGEFRRLLLLFFPLLMMSFSNYLFLFFEKLLLARYSVSAMEAAVSSAYACQVFQGPCVALAAMAQVFVGNWVGAREYRAIGPGVWQFIWFSFLSILIITPLGVMYGKYYFQGLVIGEIALPYYNFLIAINCLFPLAATLSCFYLGQGKTGLVLFTTIGAQSIKHLLTYVLIFGWGEWIPSLGIMGGAISTLVAQLGCCLVLFCVFINRQHADIYCSRIWHFQPQLFWECIHPSVLRALNRILSFTCWASIAHLMSAKGGEYSLVLSIGGTLFIILPFLTDAVCQAQLTIFSQILGTRNFHLLNKASHSGTLLILIIGGLLCVPYLIFPHETFHYLFPDVTLDPLTIRRVLLGIWASFIFFAFSFVPISAILAFKDTKFSLFMGIISWINGYALMFMVIEKMNMSADQFWLVLSLMHASNALFCFWRMKWLYSKTMPSLAEIKNPG